MIHSPFDQPSYGKKAKKKKPKRKARAKARTVKKRTPITGYARRGCQARKRRKPPARIEVVRVSKSQLEKLRRSVARPGWTDILPADRRKVFAHGGRRFFPIYSLLFMVDAVEVGRGFVPHRMTQKDVDQLPRVQFVQSGSLVDVEDRA